MVAIKAYAIVATLIPVTAAGVGPAAELSRAFKAATAAALITKYATPETAVDAAAAAVRRKLPERHESAVDRRPQNVWNVGDRLQQGEVIGPTGDVPGSGRRDEAAEIDGTDRRAEGAVEENEIDLRPAQLLPLVINYANAQN